MNEPIGFHSYGMPRSRGFFDENKYEVEIFLYLLSKQSLKILVFFSPTKHLNNYLEQLLYFLFFGNSQDMSA